MFSVNFNKRKYSNKKSLPEKNSATTSAVADQGNPRARTTYSSLDSSFILSGLAYQPKQTTVTKNVHLEKYY